MLHPLALLALLGLTGCQTLTPGQRHAAEAIGVVLLAGAIEAIAETHGHDAQTFTPSRTPGPEVRP
jgi:hypothetical protein